ncbi:hypothetical protein JTE90_026422 [Oedothorax gibbosus]|uniref:Uncharacterized protein n=1 Tax=Oedothorax gibbosus TaxID=931172 RepID=A0AAV6THT5_9ARAC|nr:hypothetical protein JTE90_026422 [Oedothorax gibbosus]
MNKQIYFGTDLPENGFSRQGRSFVPSLFSPFVVHQSAAVWSIWATSTRHSAVAPKVRGNSLMTDGDRETPAPLRVSGDPVRQAPCGRAEFKPPAARALGGDYDALVCRRLFTVRGESFPLVRNIQYISLITGLILFYPQRNSSNILYLG